MNIDELFKVLNSGTLSDILDGKKKLPEINTVVGFDTPSIINVGLVGIFVVVFAVLFMRLAINYTKITVIVGILFMLGIIAYFMTNNTQSA